MEDILVSIWCITYNHELYIRDAIEGFLSQKTNFRYEIIIHDDASIDKTAEIIKDYEKKYPDLIHGIYQKENQFSKNQPSIKWLQEIAKKNCLGKYIAVCEGDDYWIDTQKLQLQIDYLETHPECVMTVHNAIVLNYRDYSAKPRNLYNEDRIIYPEDIIMQKVLIPTASTVYRREVLKMDDFFLNAGIGDYPTLLYSLEKGNIYYFNRVMSVYRYCHNNAWTDTILKKEELHFIHSIALINFLKSYNEYTKGIYEKYIISKLQRHINAAITLSKCKNAEAFFKLCKKYDQQTDRQYHTVFKQIVRIYLQIYDENYMNTELYNFAKKFKKIIIMGAGRYAKIVKNQLDRQGIYFECFVVSNNQKTENKYLEKSVWKLDSIPFDIDNVGVIIGIDPVCWFEIVDALNKREIKNYMCPFIL